VTDNESGFEIAGERYEIPRLEDLDLDEEQILYDIAGIVQADFAPAHPEASDEVKLSVMQDIADKVRNPAFKRALAHIAYRRKHPGETFGAIDVVVGKVNALDSEIALMRGDDSPPELSSPSELDSSKSSSETSPSEDSGTPSGSISDKVVVIHAATGTGR
jgi:hypothetical protein